MPQKDLEVHLSPRLLSLSEAAEMFGLSIHTLRAWVHQGKVPVVRLDASVRIDRLDLEAVIQNAKQQWTPNAKLGVAARKGLASRRSRKQTSTKPKTAEIGME